MERNYYTSQLSAVNINGIIRDVEVEDFAKYSWSVSRRVANVFWTYFV